MAKKKARSGLRLPKKVAGVKISKPLRRNVDRFINSPLGQDIIADTLVLAAAGLASHEAERGSTTRRLAGRAGQALEHIGDSAEAARRRGLAAHDAGADFAHAMQAAGAAFVDALRERREGHVDAEAAARSLAGEGADSRKKSSPAGLGARH